MLSFFFGFAKKKSAQILLQYEFYVSLVFCALRSTTSKKDPSKESVDESQMRQRHLWKKKKWKSSSTRPPQAKLEALIGHLPLLSSSDDF